MKTQLVWNRRLTGSLGLQGHFLPEDQGSVHCLQDLGLQPETRLSVPPNTGAGLGKAARRDAEDKAYHCASLSLPFPARSRRRFYVFVHLYSRTC